jgi:hypothetical protein
MDREARLADAPPGPVRVTNGTSGRSSSASTASISAWRPINGVRGKGGPLSWTAADEASMRKIASLSTPGLTPYDVAPTGIRQCLERISQSLTRHAWTKEEIKIPPLSE